MFGAAMAAVRVEPKLWEGDAAEEKGKKNKKAVSYLR